MAGFNIEVLGQPELARALQALPLKLQRKVLRPAVRAGAKVLAEATKHSAQASFGRTADPAPHMADSIKVRAGKAKRRGDIKMIVVTGTRQELGIPATTKSGEERGYYPTALEYGWTPGVNRKRLVARLKKRGTDDGGISAAMKELGTRRVPPNPFMRRALSSGGPGAKAMVASEIARRIADATTFVDATGKAATMESEVIVGERLA